MTLTTRISIFFLSALAIVLVVYSLVFYSAGREHIEYQFTGELQGVLNSLVAAAEVEQTEVKWQPLEHSVALGTNMEFGALEWMVVGDRNRIVEQSREVSVPFREDALKFAAEGPTPGEIVSKNVRDGYQYYCQRIVAPPTNEIPDREIDEFDEITFVVGRSTMKRDALLNRLAIFVTILPLLAWSVAAVLGRWVVRRAILPVSRMADQAQSISGKDFKTRLRVSESGDELSELGMAFNRLLDRQQAALEQQSRFAGDAAHELRTPITVLLGEIDVTLRRSRSEAEYQETLGRLRQKAGTLQEIVESLLFLARSEGDGVSPHLEAVEVGAWLEEHRESWSQWPRGSDLQIEDRLKRGVCVRATRALLSRVMDNLVSNACKYSEAKTPVVVRLELERDQVVIAVSDQGQGIAAEDLPHLFEPFFRSAQARRAGQAGTGLGLAIANRIVETLGGTLVCESRLGEGSRFVVRLPVCRG